MTTRGVPIDATADEVTGIGGGLWSFGLTTWPEPGPEDYPSTGLPSTSAGPGRFSSPSSAGSRCAGRFW